MGHHDSREELDHEYAFRSAMSAGFGQAFVSELNKESRVGFPDVPVFGVSASILSPQTGQVVGVIVNHVVRDELNSKVPELPGGQGLRRLHVSEGAVVDLARRN